MKSISTLACASILLLVSMISFAETRGNKAPAKSTGVSTALPSPQDSNATPEAAPADVDSIDHIMKAVYDVISGPAGQKRNWDRMRSLFIPGARLIPTGKVKNGNGMYGSRVLSVEDYITGGSKYLEANGFFERELARKVDSYGQIIQAFSTYESRHNASDKKPFERGINSFQLMYDGKRWWIVTIFWEGESDGGRLPASAFVNRPAGAAAHPKSAAKPAKGN